ncbi:MAG: UbiA family prenyltransferase [Planctomycetota bacterium]|nr:UbiA family prenyltransferase [Planctomycetota bacterium]
MPITARIAAFLELVRFANWPTILSDVLLGIVVAFFLYGVPADPFTLWRDDYSVPWSRILWTLVGLTCFYWGGMALNAAVDVATDAQQRPDRPVPSGRISLSATWFIAVTLLIVGITPFANAFPYEGLLATYVGMACLTLVKPYPNRRGQPWVRRLGTGWLIFGVVACVARLASASIDYGDQWRGLAHSLDAALLLMAIVLYNLVHAHARWSVALLGLCRALTVLIAALAAAEATAWPFTAAALAWKGSPDYGFFPIVIAAVGGGVYIALVSLVARREAPHLARKVAGASDAPLFCHKCDHGLAFPPPSCCPECGADLSILPAIHADERRAMSARWVLIPAMFLVLSPWVFSAWTYDIAQDRLPPWWLMSVAAFACGVYFLLIVTRAVRAADVHPSRVPRAVGAMLAALPAGQGVLMAALGAPYAAFFALGLAIAVKLLQRVRALSIGS